MASIHDSKSESQPRCPKEGQGTIYTAHKQARFVLWYLYLSMIFSFVWFIAVYAAIKSIAERKFPPCNNRGLYQGDSWSIFPNSARSSSTATIVI